MSEVCIHLHSFVLVHLHTKPEVEAVRQQMFTFDATEAAKRPRRENDALLELVPASTHSSGPTPRRKISLRREAATDYVSRRHSISSKPAQSDWLGRENNPEAEPMCSNMFDGKWNLGGDLPTCFTYRLLRWFAFFQTPTFGPFSANVSFCCVSFLQTKPRAETFVDRTPELFVFAFFLLSPVFSVVTRYKFTYKLSLTLSTASSSLIRLQQYHSTDNTCSVQVVFEGGHRIKNQFISSEEFK